MLAFLLLVNMEPVDSPYSARYISHPQSMSWTR